MSLISLTSNGINGDFEILFDDETEEAGAVAGMRMVRRASGATSTVHTSQALYSAIADKTDEFLAMGFKNPMEPITPNAFRLVNKYFMPRSSTEYLKDGEIQADWSVVSGDGVYRKVHNNTGTPPDANDIGYIVTEATSGDTGTLLDYEVEPDGTTVLWIRPDTSGDTFALSTGLTTTAGMSVTGVGAATSGVSKWSSIQAIGSVPSATEVYIYQNRVKMTDWEGNFQWWATDPDVSLGIIDILIRVENAGVSIADGDVEVFGRRYTSLYDNFRLNVAAGGRSALPLASAPDINNTTGYRQFTGQSGVSDFDVGNYIYAPAAGGWSSATKKGVITKVGGTIVAPVIDYYLIGDLTDFVDTDTIKEWDPSTEADGDGSCTVNGAPIAAPGGPTDTSSGEGGSVTIALGEVSGDHNQDGTNEYYSVEVDAKTNVAIADVYERLKYACRRGADEADLFGAATEMPGEAYRGMDGLFEYDASTGALGGGENLSTITGGNTWTGVLMAQVTADTPDYITVMDQQTSLDSVIDDNVIEDEGGTEDVTVHAGGTLGLQSFTSPKQSPFGTFTGTQIFGARGVLFKNPASTDTQAYILTDNRGDIYSPPNTVAFLVDKTISGDRILVARDTGTLGVINKDQFGGMTATSVSATSITVGTSIDTEVPAAGWIRVVAVDEQQEHRYVYSSRTAGASGVFTLKAITPSSATAGTSDTALEDTGGDFVNEEVEPGMLIYVASRTSTYEVVSVTDADSLVIQLLYGSGGFVSGDPYTINETIQAYDTGDDLFDLVVDAEASTTSISNTFVKTLASDFGVVVNVRNGKVILPFTQNQNVGDSGATVTVVRTPDTIAS
jgi:hypothetical protein